MTEFTDDHAANNQNAGMEIQERAQRFDTESECLVIPHGTRDVLMARIANLSKTGALLAFENTIKLPSQQPVIIIPLDEGSVNVLEIERSRGLITGTIARDYRSDTPHYIGVALSPYPLTLFQRLVGWIKS